MLLKTLVENLEKLANGTIGKDDPGKFYKRLNDMANRFLSQTSLRLKSRLHALTALTAVYANFRVHHGQLLVSPEADNLRHYLFIEISKILIGVDFLNLEEDNLTKRLFKKTIVDTKNLLQPLPDHRLFEALENVMLAEWSHSTLLSMLRDDDVSSETALSYLKTLEHEDIVLLRIEALLAGDCEQLAQNLIKHCLKCDIFMEKPDILLRRFLFLHKHGNLDDFSQLCSKASDATACDVLSKAMQGNCFTENPSAVLLLSQTFFLLDWIEPVNLTYTKFLVRSWMVLENHIGLKEDLKQAFDKVLAFVHNSRQLVVFIDVVEELFGFKFSELCSSLALRAVQQERHRLDCAKLYTNDTEEADDARHSLAEVCFVLIRLYRGHPQMNLCCLLSWHYLWPTENGYYMLEQYFSGVANPVSSTELAPPPTVDVDTYARLYRAVELLRPENIKVSSQWLELKPVLLSNMNRAGFRYDVSGNRFIKFRQKISNQNFLQRKNKSHALQASKMSSKKSNGLPAEVKHPKSAEDQAAPSVEQTEAQGSVSAVALSETKSADPSLSLSVCSKEVSTVTEKANDSAADNLLNSTGHRLSIEEDLKKSDDFKTRTDVKPCTYSNERTCEPVEHSHNREDSLSHERETERANKLRTSMRKEETTESLNAQGTSKRREETTENISEQRDSKEEETVEHNEQGTREHREQKTREHEEEAREQLKEQRTKQPNDYCRGHSMESPSKHLAQQQKTSEFALTEAIVREEETTQHNGSHQVDGHSSRENPIGHSSRENPIGHPVDSKLNSTGKFCAQEAILPQFSISNNTLPLQAANTNTMADSSKDCISRKLPLGTINEQQSVRLPSDLLRLAANSRSFEARHLELLNENNNQKTAFSVQHGVRTLWSDVVCDNGRSSAVMISKLVHSAQPFGSVAAVDCADDSLISGSFELSLEKPLLGRQRATAYPLSTASSEALSLVSIPVVGTTLSGLATSAETASVESALESPALVAVKVAASLVGNTDSASASSDKPSLVSVATEPTTGIGDAETLPAVVGIESTVSKTPAVQSVLVPVTNKTSSVVNPKSPSVTVNPKPPCGMEVAKPHAVPKIISSASCLVSGFLPSVNTSSDMILQNKLISHPNNTQNDEETQKDDKTVGDYSSPMTGKNSAVKWSVSDVDEKTSEVDVRASVEDKVALLRQKSLAFNEDDALQMSKEAFSVKKKPLAAVDSSLDHLAVTKFCDSSSLTVSSPNRSRPCSVAADERSPWQDVHCPVLPYASAVTKHLECLAQRSMHLEELDKSTMDIDRMPLAIIRTSGESLIATSKNLSHFQALFPHIFSGHNRLVLDRLSLKQSALNLEGEIKEHCLAVPKGLPLESSVSCDEGKTEILAQIESTKHAVMDYKCCICDKVLKSPKGHRLHAIRVHKVDCVNDLVPTKGYKCRRCHRLIALTRRTTRKRNINSSLCRCKHHHFDKRETNAKVSESSRCGSDLTQEQEPVAEPTSCITDTQDALEKEKDGTSLIENMINENEHGADKTQSGNCISDILCPNIPCMPTSTISSSYSLCSTCGPVLECSKDSSIHQCENRSVPIQKIRSSCDLDSQNNTCHLDSQLDSCLTSPDHSYCKSDSECSQPKVISNSSQCDPGLDSAHCEANLANELSHNSTSSQFDKNNDDSPCFLKSNTLRETSSACGQLNPDCGASQSNLNSVYGLCKTDLESNTSLSIGQHEKGLYLDQSSYYKTNSGTSCFHSDLGLCNNTDSESNSNKIGAESIYPRTELDHPELTLPHVEETASTTSCVPLNEEREHCIEKEHLALAEKCSNTVDLGTELKKCDITLVYGGEDKDCSAVKESSCVDAVASCMIADVLPRLRREGLLEEMSEESPCKCPKEIATPGDGGDRNGFLDCAELGEDEPEQRQGLNKSESSLGSGNATPGIVCYDDCKNAFDTIATNTILASRDDSMNTRVTPGKSESCLDNVSMAVGDSSFTVDKTAEVRITDRLCEENSITDKVCIISTTGNSENLLDGSNLVLSDKIDKSAQDNTTVSAAIGNTESFSDNSGSKDIIDKGLEVAETLGESLQTDSTQSTAELDLSNTMECNSYTDNAKKSVMEIVSSRTNVSASCDSVKTESTKDKDITCVDNTENIETLGIAIDESPQNTNYSNLENVSDTARIVATEAIIDSAESIATSSKDFGNIEDTKSACALETTDTAGIVSGGSGCMAHHSSTSCNDTVVGKADVLVATTNCGTASATTSEVSVIPKINADHAAFAKHNSDILCSDIKKSAVGLGAGNDTKEHGSCVIPVHLAVSQAPGTCSAMTPTHIQYADSVDKGVTDSVLSQMSTVIKLTVLKSSSSGMPLSKQVHAKGIGVTSKIQAGKGTSNFQNPALPSISTQNSPTRQEISSSSWQSREDAMKVKKQHCSDPLQCKYPVAGLGKIPVDKPSRKHVVLSSSCSKVEATVDVKTSPCNFGTCMKSSPKEMMIKTSSKLEIQAKSEPCTALQTQGSHDTEKKLCHVVGETADKTANTTCTNYVKKIKKNIPQRGCTELLSRRVGEATERTEKDAFVSTNESKTKYLHVIPMKKPHNSSDNNRPSENVSNYMTSTRDCADVDQESAKRRKKPCASVDSSQEQLKDLAEASDSQHLQSSASGHAISDDTERKLVAESENTRITRSRKRRLDSGSLNVNPPSNVQIHTDSGKKPINRNISDQLSRSDKPQTLEPDDFSPGPVRFQGKTYSRNKNKKGRHH